MKSAQLGAQDRTIGLALSGGGSRAIAFHLGCMRALNELGLLDKVKILSTVSGGSVIGAAWAMHEGDFASFELRIRAMLRSGFAKPSTRLLFSLLGLKVVGSWMRAAGMAILLLTLRLAAVGLAKILPVAKPVAGWVQDLRSPWRRTYSRSSLFEAAMANMIFGKIKVEELSARSPRLIVNATEMRTGSAFRYSSQESGSWRWGQLASNDATLAHAVAVSAAHPMFLPAFDESHQFVAKSGKVTAQRVLLTDGGVYDNLGLGVFWPNRSAEVSLNIVQVPLIVCCCAGYGLKLENPHTFAFSRLTSAFGTTFERAQNHAIARLHELRDAGVFKSFILPHLGSQDRALTAGIPNFVPREEVHAYPTDFNAMSEHWIERISLRGEQLTRALALKHFREILG